MGLTEVDQEAYERVMEQNPSHFRGANLPVDSVTWMEAQKYCSAVGLRLPTEVEWEYAARLGTEGVWLKTLAAIAWYGTNATSTKFVGMKEANAWGLYDMLGNVWEWTATLAGSHRVLRGGSWSDQAKDIRFSIRYKESPDIRVNNIGFRCAGENLP